MATSLIHTAFVAGEISPGLYGRTDYAKVAVAGTTIRNAFISYRGGAYSRAGTAYVLRSLTDPSSGFKPHLVTFQFSINQGYCLELGANYMRFFSHGAAVVEAAENIVNATQANPCQLTVPGHGYAEGDWVAVSGVNGMTPLNGRTFMVHVVDANNIQLHNVDTGFVSSVPYPPYVSGGTTARIYQISTPWSGADVANLKFAESADVMSFVHPDYAPYDLARISNNHWTLTPSPFAPSQAPPGQPSAAASTHPSNDTSPPTLPCAYAYVVTAVDINGHESIASAVANVLDSVDMSVTAGSITVTWPSAAGAVRYNIYRAPPSYNRSSVVGGAIITAVVVNGGLGYAFGDTGLILAGNNAATYFITAVDPDGVVLTFNVAATGESYAVANDVPTLRFGTQVGNGVGFTVGVSSVTAGGTVVLPVPAGAIFSFVGSSFGLQFVDSNIISDTTRSPPKFENPFAPGQILNVTMTAFGTGYTFAFATITSSTGAGFGGVGVVVNGTVQAVIILQAGFGYGAAGEALVISGDGVSATGTFTVGPLTGTYPSVVSYYQQRRVYAATDNQPDTYFMSRPGQFLNFGTSFPSSSADAITGTPWAQQINGIQWMIPMPGGLIALTGKGAWQITGEGGSALNPQPITPTSQQAQPQQFNGVSPIVPPIQVNYDILYVQAKGATVRDAVYNYITNSYTGTDQTALSSHLFSGYEINDWAWCEEPGKVVWTVRCDGILLSFTFLKEQEVAGWARHDTQGQFVSATAVSEPPVDALYCAVRRRTRSGSDAFFIERMDDRIWTTAEQPWCVDCGLQYPLNSSNGVGLRATSHSGATEFFADTPFFTPGMVGAILRVAGGIARITQVFDAIQVVGIWILPASLLVPNNATSPVRTTEFLMCGADWTITSPVNQVYGLDHLSDMTVTGLLDGVVLEPTVVGTDGRLALPFAASYITIGLGFPVQVQTPYLDTGNPTVQGRRKDTVAVTVRVVSSATPDVGSNQPDGGAQTPPCIDPPWPDMFPAVTALPDLQPNSYVNPSGQTVKLLFSGDFRANVKAGWDERGQTAVQQTRPLPLSLTAVIPEVLPGDLPEEKKQDAPSNQRAPGTWMVR